MAEEPLLQTVRFLLAFLSQCGDAVVEFCLLAAWFGERPIPSLLDAAQFRFLILALSDHLLLLLGREGLAGCSQGCASLLCLRHILSESLYLVVGGSLQFGSPVFQSGIFRRFLDACYLMVDG